MMIYCFQDHNKIPPTASPTTGLNIFWAKEQIMLDLVLEHLHMFSLLVPPHASWRASTEIADVTFVCSTFVHCLNVDF